MVATIHGFNGEYNSTELWKVKVFVNFEKNLI